MSEQKPLKLFIATPMYGGSCTGTYVSGLLELCKLLNASGVAHVTRFIYNESLITRARDNLVLEFLEDESFTHLLFLDADIGIRAADILSLVAEDKDIIGGLYAVKSLSWDWIHKAALEGVPEKDLPKHGRRFVFNAVDGDDPRITGDKVREVVHLGTGYMLIKRGVFEALKPHTPTYVNNGMHHGKETYAFFQTSICPDTNTLLSEDYHFCKEWRAIGGKIYAAEYAQATHMGTYIFG